MTRRAGLTLLEVLVVLAIAAVLISLLVPLCPALIGRTSRNAKKSSSSWRMCAGISRLTMRVKMEGMTLLRIFGSSLRVGHQYTRRSSLYAAISASLARSPRPLACR